MAATDDMPAELATALDTFEKALADVEAALQPLLATNMEEFLATAKPADKARVEVMAAYALSSLFYMYLKVQGVSPNDHPVKKEIERLALYVRKLQSHNLLEAPNKAEADKVKRIVKHELFDVEEYQAQKGAASKAAEPQSAKRKRPTAADFMKADKDGGAMPAAPAKRAAASSDSKDDDDDDDDSVAEEAAPADASEDEDAAVKKSLKKRAVEAAAAKPTPKPTPKPAKPSAAKPAATPATASKAKPAAAGAKTAPPAAPAAAPLTGGAADSDSDEDDAGAATQGGATPAETGALTKAERRRLKKMRKRLSLGANSPAASPAKGAAAR